MKPKKAAKELPTVPEALGVDSRWFYRNEALAVYAQIEKLEGEYRKAAQMGYANRLPLYEEELAYLHERVATFEGKLA